MKDEIITECGTSNPRNNDNLRHKKEKRLKIMLEGKHSIIPVTAVSVVNCNKVRIFWRLIDRGIIYEYPSSGF